MLPTNLTTNEIRDAASAEVEFLAYSRTNREVIYQVANELPNAPFRLKYSHLESGKGLNKRRRSLLRFDKSFVSEVDTSLIAAGSCYIVLDLPIGHMLDFDEAKSLTAATMSAFAFSGVGTTMLFDSTGYGAAALVNGTL